MTTASRALRTAVAISLLAIACAKPRATPPPPPPPAPAPAAAEPPYPAPGAARPPDYGYPGAPINTETATTTDASHAKKSAKKGDRSRPPTAAIVPPPPPHPPKPPQVVPERVPPPTSAGPVDIEHGKDYATVQIYYATDRAFTGENDTPAQVFGAARGRLSRGIARVSIPRLHQIGRIEEPSVLRFEFREDPKKHVTLLSVLPQRQQDFYAKLRASVARSKKHEAFVFVHGFDNSFADAAKRTAQIKYDLAFDGAAILFSWPSVGSPKPLAYTTDEAAAEWATLHFRDFLVELARNSGAQSISVVAHSMGNRVLARAFERLPETEQLHFDQVMLTAPDIDADVFKDLAKAICKPAGHVTLYVSKNDEALKLSKQVHGYPRAGDSSESVLIVDGMETVDVSNVDTSFTGHSYIADNRTVLSDVFCLIRGVAQAAHRCRLVPRGRYWEFAAQIESVASLDRYTCAPPGCPFHPNP